MEKLFEKSRSKIAEVSTDYVRQIHDDIAWDDRLVAIVGGKNKKQKQIQGVENAYVVKDDIEYGYLNVIPLWTFVFLY